MMYSLEKEDTSRRLVQAMLSSSLEVTTAFSNIFIDRRAATASENNLKLLTEQYTRGVVSIIDLLDAQTQFVQTQQSSQKFKVRIF